MGKSYDGITPELSDWIEQQHLFFVATAPLAHDGLVNCSPKGMDTFRILGRARSRIWTSPAAASKRLPTVARMGGLSPPTEGLEPSRHSAPRDPLSNQRPSHATLHP
jgi:hypothetical protein